MSLVGIFGFIVAIAAVIWSYIQWAHQYWERKKIPFIRIEKTKERMAFADHLKLIYKEGKSRGYRYFGIYTLAAPRLVVVDPELLKLVMTKDFKHFMDRKTYINEKEPLTNHLGTADGERWKDLRPKLSPTFTSGKLKNMFHTFIESGKNLQKYLTEIAEKKEPIDIKRALEKYGIDIIGSCAFGIECNAFTDPNSLFVYYSRKHLNKSKWLYTKDTLSKMFPDLFRLTGLKLVDKEVTEFFTNLVADTISYREKNNIQRNDFLQLLINAKLPEGSEKVDGKFTMDEIVSQCFVFFNAGFQTTSSTLTFTLFELTQYPDIQDKLREEINRVLEKYDNQITYDCLVEMKYMDQCINEALRIHNPIPINGRACSEPYRIPGTDIVLDKGTKIMIPTIAIHWDEEYYPNPEIFDPDRFNEENSKKRQSYTFIPFGEGPRICIGARFGIMQIKVALTTIIKNFRVGLSEKTPLPLKRVISSHPLTRMQQIIYLDIQNV